MIKGENIIKKYAGRCVLDIPSFSVNKGERLSLTGANGSGKSTLLKILSGVIPFEGKAEINGKVLYLPQNSIAFDMSVLSNVTYSLKGRKKEKEEKAMEVLKKTGLDALYKKNALGLSGGEKARLALTRLLVLDCDVLLLDEPTGAVDVEGTQLLEELITDYIKEKNRTLIAATHSPLQAKRLSERVIMLDKGKIAEDCSPEELLRAPKTEFGKKFIDMWRAC